MKRKRKMGYGWNTRKQHPAIRIAGEFLERFGFSIGQVVEVEYEPGQIVIRSDQSVREKEAKYRSEIQV